MAQRKLTSVILSGVLVIVCTGVYVILPWTKSENHEFERLDDKTDKFVNTPTREMIDESLLSFFRPRIHGKDRDLLLRMVKVFDTIMTEGGIEYFLQGGSLLGSYRHHGLIPWDEDFDVYVANSHKSNLTRLLETIKAEFPLIFFQPRYWKLYPSKGKSIKNVPWKFPILDIFFYNENATHIWEFGQPKIIYHKSVIFPVRRRPYLDMLLPAARDPQRMIAQEFNVNECQSMKYDHLTRSRIKSTTVPCSKLRDIFPFVNRQATDSGCNETLHYNGTIVGVFFDSESISC